MQDRYLFRGKRIDDGEWEDGCLLVLDGKDYRIATSCLESADELLYVCAYKVDPSTVCQCTGAKDKNGNLIFENDIMQAHLDDEFPEDVTSVKILWHENGWCTNQYGCDDYEELDYADEKWFKVVGNMIDNPELWEMQ